MQMIQIHIARTNNSIIHNPANPLINKHLVKEIKANSTISNSHYLKNCLEVMKDGNPKIDNLVICH